MAPVRIGIAGALGRMGRAIGVALDGRPDAVVSAVFDKPGTEGQPWGSVALGGPQDAANCDVLVDFTTPAASVALAQAAATRKAPALVIGSTGWGEAEDMQIWSAAKHIPIVKSGNYSLGVNVLAGLVRQAAQRLSAADWDVEVFEAHHKRKVDAPSGTALMLGEAAARGRQSELSAVQVRARDGITGPRPEGAIGFSVMRAGGIVGEHSVTFAAEDEMLTFSHSARDRSLFARGVVEAAAWLPGKSAGLYDMQDVLGLKA